MIKNFTLILLAFIATNLLLTAQVEQVSVNPSYTHQAYYNLATGEVTQVPNDAWDIAFSNDGVQDAGVFINESASLDGNSVKAYLSLEADWATAITDVSVFSDTTTILYNAEQNWIEGAFNSMRIPNSPFDYGWGEYNPPTNSVVGNKIFVIQKRDGSFIKFQILQLIDGEYSFRYADLDGSNEATAIASKNDAGENPLIYFSFDSGETVDMPTDYDLVFQRYTTDVDDGTGTFIPYNVTGVLLSPGAEAVIADGVDPASVSESDYTGEYTTTPIVIGHHWKIFDFTAGWMIDEDRAQFVKTKNGDIYKIVFFDFEGSLTGITTLEKTKVVLSSTQLTASDVGITVYPNPTADFVYISGNKDYYNAMIYDAKGQLVLNEKIDLGKAQLNLNELNSGLYTLVLRNEDTVVNHRLIKTD